MIRRTAALITTILLAIGSLAAPVLATPGEEAGFVNLINTERANHGLNTLEVYWDLVDDARIHAQVMSEADEIFHSANLAGVTTGWSALGENVGVGPTVDVLHQAFMNSTGHRDNILGDWDSVGVGVTHSDLGYMFVTVVFMKPAQSQSAPAPAPTPEPAPVVAAVAPEPVPAPNAVVATVASEPVPAPNAVVATVASEPVPAAEPPAPEPAPQPVNRRIDALLTGTEFPFILV